MKTFLMAACLVVLVGLSGCANSISGLRNRTSGVLGFSPDKVTITNVRSDSSTTYYIAKTPKGNYACTTAGGVLKAFQMGFTNPPTCNKK